jgi:hypothetical protein
VVGEELLEGEGAFFDRVPHADHELLLGRDVRLGGREVEGQTVSLAVVV